MSWCCNLHVSNVFQPILFINLVTLALLQWIPIFHAMVPYSSFGITNMLQAISLSLGVAEWRALLRRPSVLAH